MPAKNDGHKKRPDQVRRRNTSIVTNLPPGGRKGPPPPWPLESQSPIERKRWKEIWTRPQAVVWEAWHAEDVVAQYVRMAVQCERPDAPTTLLGERRQMQVQLGLTPGAIFRLQWTLGDEAPASNAAADLRSQLKEAKRA